ncbi:MAG TPA: GFA family protein, partial [Solirubrobacteraceae bacterium]
TGGCLCGGVRFEVAAPLVSALYCHCTRCQRRSGCGASPNAVPERGSVHVTGRELLTAYRPQPRGFTKLFCQVCGSHLFSHNPDDPEDMSIRFGAFDGDPGIRPQRRQWTSSAAVWEPLPDDGLPRFPESSRGKI